MKKTALLLLFGFLNLFGLDHTVGSTGYLRLQTSFNDQKANNCFNAKNSGLKYRLGNECETWIEVGVFDDIRLDNGVKIHNQIRPIFMGPNNKEIKYLRLGELYSEVSGILNNSISFWAGRRFYERYDSHLDDYFFLNMSGNGLGFRNLSIADTKISYSYIFDRLDPTVDTVNDKIYFDSHDLRFVFPGNSGEWTLFLNEMNVKSKSLDATYSMNNHHGYAGGVLYKTPVTDKLFRMKGENISGIFYGKGVAKGAGSVSPFIQEQFMDSILQSQNKINNARTWRFINYNGFENDTWGMLSNFVYEKKDEFDFSGVKQTWISAGVRPYWFFHKNGRLVYESGYDRIDDQSNEQTYTLLKNTIALEAALDKGIWKRPVIRVYYTYAKWSDNTIGNVGLPTYSSQNHGDNAGIQVESWW